MRAPVGVLLLTPSTTGAGNCPLGDRTAGTGVRYLFCQGTLGEAWVRVRDLLRRLEHDLVAREDPRGVTARFVTPPQPLPWDLSLSGGDGALLVRFEDLARELFDLPGIDCAGFRVVH